MSRLRTEVCGARDLVMLARIPPLAMLPPGGMPAQIHIGAQRAGNRLSGHGWLTCNGQPVAEEQGHSGSCEITVYPVAPDVASTWAGEERAPCA